MTVLIVWEKIYGGYSFKQIPLKIFYFNQFQLFKLYPCEKLQIIVNRMCEYRG